MKHKLFFLLLLLSAEVAAQLQAINYQVVAQDSVGHVLVNQNIDIR